MATSNVQQLLVALATALREKGEAVRALEAIKLGKNDGAESSGVSSEIPKSSCFFLERIPREIRDQ